MFDFDIVDNYVDILESVLLNSCLSAAELEFWTNRYVDQIHQLFTVSYNNERSYYKISRITVTVGCYWWLLCVRSGVN